MLDIILKILSIVGILLLIVLLVAIIAILLVLFMPITYKVFGSKDEKEIRIRMKANWLFGFIRIRFFYPEPGNVVLKVLWFTLYDSVKGVVKSNKKEATTQSVSNGCETSEPENMDYEAERIELSEIDGIRTESTASKEAQNPSSKNDCEKANENSSKQSFLECISVKIEMIKYTIIKIYDKIKNIFVYI